MSTRIAAVVLLGLGVAFMIPFEEWYTRLLGVACLIGFVVCGLFAVATPSYLERED